MQVSRGGGKSWVFRYTLHGRAREMGLGSHVSLDLARRKASAARELLVEGLDPIAAREGERRSEGRRAAAFTFDRCAELYVDAHKAGWRNAKHAAQWAATLRTYASPTFGTLPVAAIDTAMVISVLESIWRDKTETASRVRGRIESVLDWAKVRGYRDGENPARWRGHLDKLLPRRFKVAMVKHHPALPYAEIASFMIALRERPGIAPKALQFLILTAARVSEVVNATWGEIDFEAQVWRVPPERMKAGREHRVPLTGAVLELLKLLAMGKQSQYIFPGWISDRPLTDAACRKVLVDLGRPHVTVHGFRSTFRDWCAEQTSYPRELAEAALAHVLSNKAEAAYQRGDLLERRRLLMEAWSEHCRKKPGFE